MGDSLQTLVTPGGRTLAFAVWGDPDGFPVLALHGTPGCRLERWPDEELYRRLDVCLVTHDRAGYGRSDRRHGTGDGAARAHEGDEEEKLVQEFDELTDRDMDEAGDDPDKIVSTIQQRTGQSREAVEQRMREVAQR